MVELWTLAERYKGLCIVIDILEEMTEEEMRKAGYSKTKIKIMKGWRDTTIKILDGLKTEYGKQEAIRAEEHPEEIEEYYRKED